MRRTIRKTVFVIDKPISPIKKLFIVYFKGINLHQKSLVILELVC